MINSITKPAKTYKEQVQLLKDKGIIINNDAEAERFLSKVNYYKLSGYYLPYIDKTTEKVKRSISFNRIKSIYKFDRELSSLVLKSISTIEIYLRTSIAYYYGHKYGGEGYEDAINFNLKHDHKRLLKDIAKYADRNKHNPIIIHHNQQYNGHYPIWVIIEFFELGSLSAFYRDMLNIDKTTIASDLYGANYQKLESWFACLVQIRNKCCHFNRLYYSHFTTVPISNSFSNFTPDHHLFTQLMVLKQLFPNKKEWKKKFILPLIKLLLKYNMFSELKNLDFPKNWYKLITK